MKHVIMVMVALLGIVAQSAEAMDKGSWSGKKATPRVVDGTRQIREATNVDDNIINKKVLKPVIVNTGSAYSSACSSKTGNLLESYKDEKTSQVCFFHVDPSRQQLVRALYGRNGNSPYLESLYLKDARGCVNIDQCAADNNGWSLRAKYWQESNGDITTVYDSAKGQPIGRNDNGRSTDLQILGDTKPAQVSKNEAKRQNTDLQILPNNKPAPTTPPQSNQGNDIDKAVKNLVGNIFK